MIGSRGGRSQCPICPIAVLHRMGAESNGAKERQEGAKVSRCWLVSEVRPWMSQEEGQVELNNTIERYRFIVMNFGPWTLESLGTITSVLCGFSNVR